MMNFSHFRNFIVAAFMVVTLIGCSVKEDRTPCPCWLDIFPEKASEKTSELYLTGWSGSEELYRAALDPVSDMVPYWEIAVHKGSVICSAVCGIDLDSTDGHVDYVGHDLIVRRGYDFSPVWASLSPDVDCTGEFAEDHVVLHKQHAWLHLKTNREEWLAEQIAVRVVGDVCGMDVRDLSPVEGTMQYAAEVDAEGNYLACLPRQKDNSLRLEVYMNGNLFTTIPLGELIAQTPYDWGKADLDDIWLELSLAERIGVTIRVNDWETKSYMFII